MKISLLERFTIQLTALALAFLAGWFFCRQYEARRAFVPDVSAPALSQAPLPSPTPAGERVNINTADLQALTTLPGIGKQRAEDIIAHREAHGPFPIPEAITDVPGIGEATLKNIIDRITVEE